MFRALAGSLRGRRLVVLSLITLVTAVSITTDSAEARRRRHGHRHIARASSYSPPFASIIVDGNSGAVLQANNPDSPRHPASLTKIMTLYMLFEKLEQGKLKLDSEMEVSEHASEQAPTKLGLRPGSTLTVEDAIKGLVTRSANDAAVVIAETIAGEEEDFAKLMTRKARALGMGKTVYRNASGLPDDEQITTARDQATLGRAIQDRFPRYYRYFATASFNYRGRVIRNHNRLIGSVEGVDGIKTGYTRASGFNLVTSLKRGNRHLVGVVLGGRSGGSRDATMRSLLAENMDKAATRRTVAAITEGDLPDAKTFDQRIIAEPKARPAQAPQVAQAAQVTDAEDSRAPREPAPMQLASAGSEPAPAPLTRSLAPPASVPAAAAPQRPAPFTNGVISAQPMPAIPGSSEPMTPVRVKTVQVKAGGAKVAAVAPAAAVTTTSALSPPRPTDSIAAKSDKVEARLEMPRQPANHGTGNGILGVLPAAGAPHASAMAYADPAPRAPAQSQTPQPSMVQKDGAIKPAVRSGWIIQVGALESESEAKKRLDNAREHAAQLSKAEPFTEAVDKGDKRLYRARFAGLDKDKAEAVCKALKRSDISCIAIKN